LSQAFGGAQTLRPWLATLALGGIGTYALEKIVKKATINKDLHGFEQFVKQREAVASAYVSGDSGNIRGQLSLSPNILPTKESR
jgi:hypothetical protein